MSDVATIHKAVALSLSTEEIAGAFCALDDDAQAQFFVHVAAKMRTWGHGKSDMQRLYIAHHLRDCSCTTDEAREWIADVADEMRATRQQKGQEE